MDRLSVLLILGAAVVVIAVLAIRAAVRRQERTIAADAERLIHAGSACAPLTEGDAQALAALPPPVARYLRLAIPTATQIHAVRISQTGTLRTDATAGRWMAFTADHLVVPPARGFLWNARVQVAPLLHVRVRDMLVDGSGSGRVSVMSAFTVSASGGGLEMNAGSLHRYLAEAVWYPTALWPGPNLHWTGIDETRALATLTSHGVTVSLEFRFAPGGEVTGIYTPGRWGAFAGGFTQLPWEGHFRDYREREGLVVPTEGDVGWYLDGKWRPVWKGTIVAYQVQTGAE